MTNKQALMVAKLRKIEAAAIALLAKIDNLTTEQFQLGGERPEREALRKALDGAR